MLTSRQIQNAKTGKLQDGKGLILKKADRTKGYWVLRFTFTGKRREMGLGPWPDISLKQAREVAMKARQLVLQGIDPIDQRNREKAVRAHTFEDVATLTYEAEKSGLKGNGLAGRWFSPLRLHVIPKIGKEPITNIDQIILSEALKPIWAEKPVTADKALNRTRIVLKYAAAMGLNVDLQAPDKAKALLGVRDIKEEPIPSMPWQEIPHYFETLAEPTHSNLALKLTILTGGSSRSGPLRSAKTDQFDLETGIWTVPGSVMKGKKGKVSDFRVPLSSAAIAVVRQAMSMSRNGWLFPGASGNKPISENTMSTAMKRAGLKYRPHGFRTSIRVWMSEETDTSEEVARTMLAQKVGDKVDQSYRRTDQLEKRRCILEQWAAHVTGQTKGAEVVPLRRKF